MQEIKEYIFDKDFTIKIEKIHEFITVPRYVLVKGYTEPTRFVHKSYNEYYSFKELKWNSKIIIEDNLFNLIEFNQILRLFSMNNLDKREIYEVEGFGIIINQKKKPYQLLILNDETEINLTAYQCLVLSAKIQKMLNLIEPIPYKIS